MIDGEYIERIVVKEEVLKDRVLPLLREQVFHVTSLERYSQICISGAILTNRNGLLGSTSAQSKGCLGRHINAVCLFDLRSQSEDAVQWGLDCYYFLGRPQHGNEIVFLFLDSRHYLELLKREDLDASTRIVNAHLKVYQKCARKVYQSWPQIQAAVSFLLASEGKPSSSIIPLNKPGIKSLGG